jgi:3-oxoacyl-[acyl-carrier-protein] synthase-1
VSGLAIEAVGAITPVGEDAPATVGSIFTEVRAFDPLPIEGADGRLVTGAATPIPHAVNGLDRLVMLGAFALRESTLGLAKGTEIGLVVCAPAEKDEAGLVGQTASFLARLAAEADVATAPKASRVFSSGRNATLEALVFAQAALRLQDVPAVCLLGVDSLVTKARLTRMVRSAVAGAEPIVPGEAAAAILLNRRQGPNSLAVLAGSGAAEASSRGAPPSRPNPGNDLASSIAMASAEAGLSEATFAALLHDLPASQAGFEELTWLKGCPLIRASRASMNILSPSFSVGETGAASGVLSLVTLAFLIAKGVVTDPGLCLFTLDGNGHGVAIMTPSLKRKTSKASKK